MPINQCSLSYATLLALLELKRMCIHTRPQTITADSLWDIYLKGMCSEVSEQNCRWRTSELSQVAGGPYIKNKNSPVEYLRGHLCPPVPTTQPSSEVQRYVRGYTWRQHPCTPVDAICVVVDLECRSQVFHLQDIKKEGSIVYCMHYRFGQFNCNTKSHHARNKKQEKNCTSWNNEIK